MLSAWKLSSSLIFDEDLDGSSCLCGRCVFSGIRMKDEL